MQILNIYKYFLMSYLKSILTAFKLFSSLGSFDIIWLCVYVPYLPQKSFNDNS